MKQQGAKSISNGSQQEEYPTRSRNENLSEEVYSSLKSKILKCEIPPGEQIIESALARDFGVSRTPVREALRRLIQEGYVIVHTGAGYSVSPITVKSVAEIYELRSILEGESAELATPNMSEEQIRELSGLLDTLGSTSTVDSSDDYPMAYVDVNYSFHMEIAETSGNAHLARFIGQLVEESSRLVYLESSFVGLFGIEESREVLSAIRSRDGQQAHIAMQHHIDSTYERIVESLVNGQLRGLGIRKSQTP